MIPYLHLHIGSLDRDIPIFGLMLWVAAVAAGLVMERSFRRAKISADAFVMVLVTVLAGIIGAKLWHVIDTPSEFRAQGWSVLWDTGGFAWFGGLTFGISALVIQGIRAKIGALRILDLAAPAAAFGYGIGRIGCFLSGDGCYGKPTNLPWGMAFPHGIEPVYVPVHPTPLYELAAALLIGTFLWIRAGKPRPTGAILGEYLLLTGLARFSVEFLRINPHVLWGMSNAQIASIGSTIAGIVFLVWLATRSAVAADHPAPLAIEKPA
ncbi:MAG TPA: prolipoprotein diacylglyceryl transferase [Terracidiphilus sp.]|jgi:phosphatidylglycerol:prolipoprotein diacylglycerol transferase|nr:prolipoprotein diacylglyceryl transferase [Terracidiphilus sp.]